MNIDGLRGARPPVGRKKPVDEGLKPCGLFENHARAFPVLVAPEVAEEFAVRRPHARFHGASFRLERVLEFRDFKDACGVGGKSRRADVVRGNGGKDCSHAKRFRKSPAKLRHG